jgi:hypothetical protein
MRPDTESMGRARQLRREIAAEEMPALLRLSVFMAPLHRRFASKPSIRAGMLVDLQRQWRDTLPTRFRLSFVVERHGTCCTITEHRLVSGTLQPVHDPAWSGWETGLMVLRHSLYADKRGTKFSNEIVAFISLHAIARWLARSRDNTEPPLLRDLTTLALSPDIPGDMLNVPTPHGAWVGRIVSSSDPETGRNIVVRAARSFIDADMLPETACAVALAGNRG